EGLAEQSAGAQAPTILYGRARPLRHNVEEPMNEAQTPSVETPLVPLEGGKYVYCIIRSERQREFGGIGIGGGQRVYTVHHNDLAAVVSDTPIVIYDPTRENVLAHEFVNETVMKENTVIPMSFGT